MSVSHQDVNKVPTETQTPPSVELTDMNKGDRQDSTETSNMNKRQRTETDEERMPPPKNITSTNNSHNIKRSTQVTTETGRIDVTHRGQTQQHQDTQQAKKKFNKRTTPKS